MAWCGSVSRDDGKEGREGRASSDGMLGGGEGLRGWGRRWRRVWNVMVVVLDGGMGFVCLGGRGGVGSWRWGRGGGAAVEDLDDGLVGEELSGRRTSRR